MVEQQDHYSSGEMKYGVRVCQQASNDSVISYKPICSWDAQSTDSSCLSWPSIRYRTQSSMCTVSCEPCVQVGRLYTQLYDINGASAGSGGAFAPPEAFHETLPADRFVNDARAAPAGLEARGAAPDRDATRSAAVLRCDFRCLLS